MFSMSMCPIFFLRITEITRLHSWQTQALLKCYSWGVLLPFAMCHHPFFCCFAIVQVKKKYYEAQWSVMKSQSVWFSVLIFVWPLLYRYLFVLFFLNWLVVHVDHEPCWECFFPCSGVHTHPHVRTLTQAPQHQCYNKGDPWLFRWKRGASPLSGLANCVESKNLEMPCSLGKMGVGIYWFTVTWKRATIFIRWTKFLWGLLFHELNVSEVTIN